MTRRNGQLFRFLLKSGKFLIKDKYTQFDVLKLGDVVMLLEQEVMYEGDLLLRYEGGLLLRSVCSSFLTPSGKVIIIPFGDATRFFGPIETHYSE